MRKLKCAMWLVVAIASLVGVAGAQSDMGFLTEQVCVIDSGSTTTYWALSNNYAQSQFEWSGPFTAATALAYDLPIDEWVGIFIYDADLGSYLSGQYNVRYTSLYASARDGADAVLGDTLLASGSSALGFSASSSQVVAEIANSSAWLLSLNFTQSTQVWTDLPLGASVASTITLGNAQEWVGCFLYDQVSGTWDDDAYYTMWNSLGSTLAE